MKIRKILILSTLLLLIVNIQLFAQSDLTIHLMRNLPQSNQTNPALIPSCKFHLGIPGLSSITNKFNIPKALEGLPSLICFIINPSREPLPSLPQ